MSMAITIIYSIISILILFLGIVLLRYFAQRKIENDSYKPALFVYIIWFIFTFLVLSSINSVISLYLFSLSIPLRVYLINIQTILTLIIELFIISTFVMYFYKINFEDSIFITIQVMSIQILIKIIVTNILAILFNLTTGGFNIFYFFQS